MYWTLFLTFVKIGMFTIGGEEDMGRFCLCLGYDSPFFCNHALDRVILYAGKG